MGVGIIAIVLIALVMARVAWRDAGKDVALQSGTKPRRSVMEPIWDLPTRSKVLISAIVIAAIFIVSNAGALGLRGWGSTSSSSSYSASSSSSYTSTKSTSSTSSTTTTSYSSKQYSAPTTMTISEYVYSSELTDLRNTLDVSADNLMDLLTSGNKDEIRSRSMAVSNAMAAFGRLNAPIECSTLREYYIQAAKYMVYGLDATYETLVTSKDRTSSIKEATRYFNNASDSVVKAVGELDRLKREY